MFLGIDLTDKRFVILGLQGSGKSVLVKSILGLVRNSMVYDVLKEHQGFNRYLVTYRQVQKHTPQDPAIAELNTFVNRVVIGSGQIRLFILEEANRYCPSKPQPLPASILDLNDFQRHERIAFGSVARRPVQLHTDLVELAHYLFVYRLPGKNDRNYLDEIADGLGDAVLGLKDFHFVIVYPDRHYEVHAPVPYKKS